MKKFIWALLLLGSFVAQAQIVFEKAYFIDNSGKRNECYILNVDWRDNPVAFDYKTNLGQQDAKTALIKDVSEFGIDGVSRYKRFNIKIERAADNINKLTRERYPQFKDETLFLKFLIEGEANLYVYNDHNLIRYFYDTKAVPTEQLVCIKYLSLDYFTRSNNQFRQQLFNNVRCSGETEKDFDRIGYTKNDLMRRFTKYNACQNAVSVNYEAKRTGKAFALNITPGLGYYTMTVDDPAAVYNVSTSFSKVAFKMGATAEYYLPFNKNAWTIVFSPAYNHFKADHEFSKKDGLSGGGQTVDYTAKLDYTSLEMPLGLRHYFFASPKTRIFLEATYGFDLLLHSRLSFENAQNLANAKTDLPIASSRYFSLSAGCTFDRFSAAVKYDTAKHMTAHKGTLYTSANLSAVTLLISYKLL